MYTVKQLSDLAGVTPRTLRHYDEIGLLKPSSIGGNGYRYYDNRSVLMLQQVLFFRELGLPLDEIKKVMNSPDFDVVSVLESHRFELGKRIARLERLLGTVENTISTLKGIKVMNIDQIFDGFSEQEQDKYAAEAEEKYDAETVKASNRKWKAYSAEEKKRILDEGKQITIDFLAAMPKGADSPEAQLAVEHWRNNLDNFWTPNLDQLVGLAELYNDDPRFKDNYDKMHPDLARFIQQAVRIYVDAKKA